MRSLFSLAASILTGLPFYAQSLELQESFAQLSNQQIGLTSPDGLTVEIPTWTPSWNRGLLHQ